MLTQHTLERLAQHIEGCITCTQWSITGHPLCAQGRQILAWSVACHQAGGCFIGLQPGVPECGVEAQILVNSLDTGSTLAVPLTKFSKEAVEARLSSHLDKYGNFEPSVDMEQRLRGSRPTHQNESVA